jgi:hypothetical protein
MIQLIVDYLFYDTHACSVISETLIKLLGANRQDMVGAPGSSILSRRSSRIAALYGSRCQSLMSLGEDFPRFSSSFSDVSSTSTLASTFSSSLNGSARLIFLDFALGSAKLILSNILERSFTYVEVLPDTTLLAVVERETGFATQSEDLIRMKTIVGVHVLIGSGAIATHMTCLTSRSISL